MTIGNFVETLGTEGFDSLTGSNLEIIYGVEDNDSLVSGSGESLDETSTTILVGGTGRNLYSIRENSTAIIFENGNSDDTILYTTILASGINSSKESFTIAEIDNRHLYFGNTISNQYAILIDWQKPKNIIENFDFANGYFSYDEFVNSYQNVDGYLGDLTWEQFAETGAIEVENSGIELAAIDDSLNAIVERSQSLEGIEENSQIGNFSEVLGIDGFDSISGADLQIIYSLEGDDVLNSFPNFGGGSLPNGGETTILVGGSGTNDYQVRTNSTAIAIENGSGKDNILWTTIGNRNSSGIGLEKETSFFTEIDNRHLYLGDTASNQYVILVDWQKPANQIERFDFVEEIVSYSDFADSFRDSNGYRGNITWDELSASEQIDLERLGLETTSIESTLEQIQIRSTELENQNELQIIELFRFRNTTFDTGTYIFVGEEEKNNILENENFSSIFKLEGVGEDGNVNPAFKASLTPNDSSIPFYRLRNLQTPGTYLFVSTEEYNSIFADNSDQREHWIKEGFDSDNNDIAEFYLYGSEANLGIGFNRFQNTQNNTFLYAGEEEINAINSDSNLASLFTNQGSAFEAFA